MANSNDNSLTSALVSVTKWSGKTAFGFFVIALITTMIMISIANPNVTHFTANGDDQVVDTFRVQSTEDMQFFLGVDNGDAKMDFTLQQIKYVDAETGDEYDDRQSSSDTEVYYSVFTVRDSVVLRQETLTHGDYRIVVSGEEGVGFTIGTGEFEIALVALAAVFWVIFSVAISIFGTVLPFTIGVLIINAVADASTTPTPPSSRPQRQTTTSEPTQTRSAPVNQNVQFNTPRRDSPLRAQSYVKGTPFEALTKNDWVAVIIATVFFIIFLSDPDGPWGFFALVLGAVTFYNITEREKTKDRIQVLLQRYNNTSIKFLADQLDKKEDSVIDVLRIMILDDGLPIRMDLIRGTVEKIGEFSEMNLRYGADTSGPVVQQRVTTQTASTHQTPPTQSVGSTVQEQTPVAEPAVEEEPVEEEVQPVTSEPEMGKTEKTDVGEVRDFSSYCSSCGEGLLKETKYCYSCGARQ